MTTDILTCDEGCLYTERSAERLHSSKTTGIARCVRHGLVLYPATWTVGMTIDEARQKRDEQKRKKARA